ncbi:MAG: FecR domain-containing protein [Akkermansiaceae bacterium]
MSHDWQDWIDRMSNDDASEQELREFQGALQESPENIDAYLEVLLTDASLEMKDGLLPIQAIHPEVSEDLTQNLVPDASLNTPLVPSVAPASGALAPLSGRPAAYSLPSASRSGKAPLVIALAASVAVLLGVGWMIFNQSKPSTGATQVAEHIATISDASGIADASGLRIGMSLSTEEIIVPAHANISIAMTGGARLDVNGPARLRLDGPADVFLHRGRVETYAPDYVDGFVIHTNQGKLVDIGTRFVTVSREDAKTEVHVIDGLVKAQTDGAADHFVRSEEARLISLGAVEPTDYLANRLNVPVDPTLPDTDADGVADVIEKHYGTREEDPRSTPERLRIHESFSGYDAGAIDRVGFEGKGKISQWSGSGTFLTDGLIYANSGKSLVTTGGCFQTNGAKEMGATILPDGKELPDAGVIYVSFLMQQPKKNLNRPFSGMLLYDGEYKEQLFAGELSQADSYGSRYAEGNIEDAFAIPADDKPHLFVIRIDRTRLVTDVFVDPSLSEGEAEAKSQKRYQNAPLFDRIQLRSGSDSGEFSVRFDEIRVGLDWESVLPTQS